MNAPSLGRRFAAIVVATILFLASGTLAWAAASDYQAYDLAPANTKVAGRDISGMNRDQARAVVQANVVAPVQKPVTVLYLGQPYTFSGSGVVSVNVEEMLDRAFAPNVESSIDERIIDGVVQPTAMVDIPPVYTVDAAKVTAWVADFARRVADKPYVDASVALVGGRPAFTRARIGYRTDQAAAVRAISAALVTPRRAVDFPVTVLQPKVNDSKYARVIVVDKSERRLYLYKDMRQDRTFRVAVGQPKYPTPLGAHKIVEKRYRPTWRNPGSAWAKSMPAYIAPGPGNPLGTRALNLSASGIRIHGTNKISSIGTAASHGCIRMVRKDIEWLYDQVPVGTPVYVVP